MLKYNPFKPGSIIHPGMFAGRYDEIKALEGALFQTLNGNAFNFLIHGERGIGKSSLLLYINELSRGGIKSLEGKTYNFITINVELEPSDTYGEIIRKIARELQRELDKNAAVKKTLLDVWDFITKWEVLGVKYKRESVSPEDMLEELAEKIIVVSQKASTALAGIDGFYIFIDEADKVPIESNLGTFIKVFTERLVKHNCNNVALGIIGISNVIGKMRASHESSVRILTPFELKPLIPQERKDVVIKGLAEATAKNGFSAGIDDAALELLSRLSEGYPHFIQQYAFSAFEHDSDNKIDEDDVIDGLLKENGALHQLGIRYFEEMYSGEIYSDDYRTVLQVMAQHQEKYISRQLIINKSELKPHTVDNAINALKKKNIILAKKGEKGSYCLPSSSFRVWIRAFKIAGEPDGK